VTTFGLPYGTRATHQTELVMWRSGVAVLRNRGALLSKILPSLFFAFIIGAIYSDTGNDQKSIQDKIGALFFFTINQTFGNLLAVRQAVQNNSYLLILLSAGCDMFSCSLVGPLVCSVRLFVRSFVRFESLLSLVGSFLPSQHRWWSRLARRRLWWSASARLGATASPASTSARYHHYLPVGVLKKS